MVNQLDLSNTVNDLKNRASEYARTDRMGHVLFRSFDLIGGATRDGFDAASVRDLSELLKRDRDFAREKDDKENASQIPRDLVYGLVDSLGSMVDLFSEKGAEELEEMRRLKEQVESLTKVEVHHENSIEEPTRNVQKEDLVNIQVNQLQGRTLEGAALGDRMKEEMLFIEGGMMIPKMEEDFNNDTMNDMEGANRCVSASQRPSRGDPKRTPSAASSAASSSSSRRRSTPAAAAAAARLSKDTPRNRFVATPKGKHPCNVCSYGADSTASLAIHTRKHTGERPFQCSACTMSFTSKSNLNRHAGVHKK